MAQGGVATPVTSYIEAYNLTISHAPRWEVDSDTPGSALNKSVTVVALIPSSDFTSLPILLKLINPNIIDINSTASI